MRMRFGSLAFATLGALIPVHSIAAQQTKVVPHGMDHVQGQISCGFLFNRTDADFFLLYDANQITSGQAQLTGIDFRQGQQFTPLLQGYTKPFRVIAFTVPINAVATAALGSSVNVAAITGGAAGTVVFQGPVTFPTHAPLTLAPGPFDMNFPFSVPYAFDATQGNLLLRIQATDTTPVLGSYLIDAVAMSTGYGIVTDVEATGCASGATSVSLRTQNTSVVTGRSIDTTLTITPGVGALLVALSLDRADLDLTPFGLPGCASRVGPTVAVQTLLPAPPAVPHALWPVPAVPAFAGTALFTQAAALLPGGGPPAVSNTEGLLLASPVLSINKVVVFWTGSTWAQISAIELMPVVRLDGTFP
jgi:hypothetical protein